MIFYNDNMSTAALECIAISQVDHKDRQESVQKLAEGIIERILRNIENMDVVGGSRNANDGVQKLLHPVEAMIQYDLGS